MSELFALHYRGSPFISLGTAHSVALLLILGLNLGLTRFRGASARTRPILRWTLAITLWVAETSWHIWNIAVGAWDVRTMLPLNLCSILIWLSPLMLVLRDYHVFEFAYFLGIGGALQYLATPDLGTYGFPHFRFIQAFTSHGLLLTAPIYMAVVEGFRPTWGSLWRVVIGANLYMAAVFLVNLAIGSNYLMLNAKPGNPSLLDLLPAWPYYMPFMELIGFATCLLLMLPWILADARSGRPVRNYS